MLKDDIFITKDRTKFFDYILPVIPVLDSSNSYNKLKEFFEGSTVADALDDRFLKGVALYIDDLRILKNIYNEYVLYYEKLNKINLDPNRMLALITYKNLFPRDFADLQLNKGFVHAIFASKEKICNKEIERINDEIRKQEERLSNSRKELATSLEELEDIREAKSERITDWDEFEKWEKQELSVRKQAIKDRDIDTEQLLKKRIEELKEQKRRIAGWSISRIINRDNVDEIFKVKTINALGEATDYHEIKQSEYFNLLKYLIRNGYIDESYSDYMTYFYENSLSLNDKTYLRAVNDKKAKEYSYNLDSPSLVLSNLIPADFLQEETLNFDLLEYMLDDESEKSKECLDNLAFQIRENQEIEFVSQYFGLNKKRPAFVRWLNSQWTRFFIIAYCRKVLSDKVLLLYSQCSVAYCFANVLNLMNEQRVLSNFISQQTDFLLLESGGDVYNRIMKNLIVLDIKFDSINPQSDKGLLTKVYKNDLYIINSANLRLFLGLVYDLNWEGVQKHIMTAVISDKEQPLYRYACENINDTVEVINSISTEGIDDNEEAVLFILNSDKVSEENKNVYISLLKTVLHDLGEVRYKICRDALLRRRLVEETVENIYEYFSKQSLTEVLVDFINGISNKLDFSVVTYDNNIVNKFVGCIQSSNQIVDMHYRSILSAKGKVLTNFNKKLDGSKVKILIAEHKLQMNIPNLLHLRQYYPNCVQGFIHENISEYCKIVTPEHVEVKEIEKILSWRLLKFEDAKHLIDVVQTKLKVIDHEYGDSIIIYILNNRFSEMEFIPLLKAFANYSENVQGTIIKLADSRMNKVAESINDIEFNVLKRLLASNDIQDTNKIILLCSIIKTQKNDLIKEALSVAGYEEVSKLLDRNARPRILVNDYNEKLLKELKASQYITSYEANQKSGIYRYSRPAKTDIGGRA